MPHPVRMTLGFASTPGIAVGAYLNNRLCAAAGQEAWLSPDVGDLNTRAACTTFAAHFSALLEQIGQAPQWVAADLHPDFYSTGYGRAFADAQQLPFIQVQHHHAHIGSVLAEHQLLGPVLGLALDGYGLGSDGQAWGGELLRVDGARMERLGHLHPLALPGGDRAAREPWRMAAAVLFDLGRSEEIVPRFGAQASLIQRMIEQGLNTPRTSSAGRLFDAAAGLLGIKPVARFEAEAAMLLEQLAAEHGDIEALPGGHQSDQGTLSLLPLLARLADMRDVAHAAALFHAGLAAALSDWVQCAAEQQQISQVVLGGGCFHNRILSRLLRARLEASQLTVWEARQLSPGDAGLSLGQAWVAWQTLAA